MCQHLPYSDIKINNAILFDDVINTPDDSYIGYMVEVNISLPEEIHEVSKQCVPCPENIIPKTEWCSEYQKELQLLTHDNTNTDNFQAHLCDREHYTAHYRNLKMLHYL